MARHARLVAPPAPPRQEWPWHKAEWNLVPVSQLAVGDRRFEAEGFLSSGLDLKTSVVSKRSGWAPLGTVANIVQPARTKATLVSPGYGKPFLTAGQMFEIRPYVRKWLAEECLPHPERLYATEGTIIVRRSADVGRMTLTLKHHEGHLISDHFFRVAPKAPELRGWLYAFLRSRQAKAMMVGAQYGHIIKHIEISHLANLPVPEVDVETAADFERRVVRLLELRNQSYAQTLEAERLFQTAVGQVAAENTSESGYSVPVSPLISGRRRLDGAYHSPTVTAIKRHLSMAGNSQITLRDAGYEVWVPNRYRRIPASDGVRYLDSADLLEVSPDGDKRFADCGFGDRFGGRVEKNWLLMPCSGQVYGIIGSVVMAGAALQDSAVSNHVIRIVQEAGEVRPGYVLTAMSHPTLGRPLIKAMAFGSSVPEIDPDEVKEFQIVRLGQSIEDPIADCAEASANARAEADALEQELAEDAGRLIDEFIAGGKLEPMNGALHTHGEPSRPVPLAEHARVRLREGLPKYHLGAGATGTVVHVYRGKNGLEVEFGANDAAPKVVTLTRDAVEPADD